LGRWGLWVLQLKKTVDVGQVHLNAVFFFIDRLGHDLETDFGSIWLSCLCAMELGDQLRI
jgi:hypothetical protein